MSRPICHVDHECGQQNHQEGGSYSSSMTCKNESAVMQESVWWWDKGGLCRLKWHVCQFLNHCQFYCHEHEFGNWDSSKGCNTSNVGYFDHKSLIGLFKFLHGLESTDRLRSKNSSGVVMVPCLLRRCSSLAGA